MCYHCVDNVKHAIYVNPTLGPTISFHTARTQPEHRHGNLTLTLYNYWSHVDSVTYQVS